MLLEQERERADHFEHKRKEEDEALSGELRDIMANLGATVSTMPPQKPTSTIPATENEHHNDDDDAKNGNALCSATPNAAGVTTDLDTSSDTGADKDDSNFRQGIQPTGNMNKRLSNIHIDNSLVNDDDTATCIKGGIASATPCFDEEGRVEYGRNDVVGDNRSETAEGAAEGGLVPQNDESEFDARKSGIDDDAAVVISEGKKPPSCEITSGGVVGGWVVRGGVALLQQQQGALRARVVELELQRREAAEQLKTKTDQSLRLEVQVNEKYLPPQFVCYLYLLSRYERL